MIRLGVGTLMWVVGLGCMGVGRGVSPTPPAPPPPGPERAAGHLTGAVSVDVSTGLLRCDGTPEGDLEVRVSSRASEAVRWDLYASLPASGTPRLWLVVGPQSWGDSEGRREVTGVARHGSQVHIDSVLTPKNARGRVVVNADIVCSDRAPTAAVPAQVVAQLAEHTGARVRPFATVRHDQPAEARAISALVDWDHAAAALQVLALSDDLGPGWGSWLGAEVDGQVQVVVGPATEPAHVVRLAHVDPVGHGLGVEDVADRLSEWNLMYGVRVVQADSDSVTVRFDSLPEPFVSVVAAEAKRLCPLAVPSGPGGTASLEEQLQTTRAVACWWD